MGLIADIQAIRATEGKLEECCRNIVRQIAQRTSLSRTVLDNLIE